MKKITAYHQFNQEECTFTGSLNLTAIFPAVCRISVFLLTAALVMGFLAGCASKKPRLEYATWQDHKYPVGTILSSSEKGPVTFEKMLKDLLQSRIVYVGESHTNAAHHDVQLRILLGLHMFRPDLSTGMEMFSRPYQSVLDEWVKGELDEQAFIRNTHWYANWKYDYELYRGLLEYIRDQGIPLYALNIAFHVPPKIAAGGIDSLLAEDKARLPEQIDLSNQDHREFVRDIFEQHSFGRGDRHFEHFYEAQCVWEDVMAESISNNIANRPMIVFAGKGHLANRYGIPDRAYTRTGVSFKILLPVSAGQSINFEEADYFWITPSSGQSPRQSPH
ncbi:MAG: ChaN family lipoprotein [Desulfosalsimonas sp.]